MASLLIANLIEVLNDGEPSRLPACAGATFYLAPGYDLGAPQPITDIVGELVLDGERPFGRRSGNRTITLPIVITAPDQQTLTAARETLLQTINPETWTLTWVNDSGLPLIFDCFRAAPAAVTYSIAKDRQLACQQTVTFQALPYGRSDTQQTLTFASPVTGSPPSPPAAVTLDDYETVSGSGWSLSTIHQTGTHSAHFTYSGGGGYGFYGGADTATYTSTFTAKDITGLPALQHWAGFAVNSTYQGFFSPGSSAVSFSYTLTDSSGRTLSFSGSQSVVPSATSTPNWYLVSASIPTSSSFTYTSVVKCAITITSYSTFADYYLDNLTAQPATSSAVASVRGSFNTLRIVGTSHAPVNLTFQQPGLGTFKTLIAHIPGPDSPTSLTPFVSVGNGSGTPNGATSYTVASTISGVNARFSGTYTILAVNNSWNSPSASRTLTIGVSQTDYTSGPSTTQTVARTFIPNTDISGGLVVVGELTLPQRDIPPDNVAMIQAVTVLDTNTSDRFLDVLFLDTSGETVIINTASGYAIYYLDEPDATRDLGRVLGSSTDRSRAVSVLDSAFVSGGPLTVDPSGSTLLTYCVEGAPAILASYSPRWHLDRLA